MSLNIKETDITGDIAKIKEVAWRNSDFQTIQDLSKWNGKVIIQTITSENWATRDKLVVETKTGERYSH